MNNWRLFKAIEQKTNYDCGVAVVKMALETAKPSLKISYGKVLDMLGANNHDGVSVRDIKKVLEKYEVGYEIKDLAKVEDLKIAVDNGDVVMVAFQTWFDLWRPFEKLDDGHFSLVIGYENENLILADPSVHEEVDGIKKGIRIVDEKTFEKNWFDREYKGALFDHWMLDVKIGNPRD